MVRRVSKLVMGGLIAAAAMATSWSCNRPELREAQLRRDATIDHVLASCRAREAGRPENLREVHESIEWWRIHHQERLAEMDARLRDDIADRQAHWDEIQPQWRQRLRKMLSGDPAKADQVMIRLFD